MRVDTNALLRRRYERQLNQNELAEAAGISKSHMSEIESGKSQPSPAALGRLAEALKCDPADLIVPIEGAA